MTEEQQIIMRVPFSVFSAAVRAVGEIGSETAEVYDPQTRGLRRKEVKGSEISLSGVNAQFQDGDWIVEIPPSSAAVLVPTLEAGQAYINAHGGEQIGDRYEQGLRRFVQKAAIDAYRRSRPSEE